jgi:uncharacterized pyridoxamine 5'-phosphate oxidase family protein
VKLNCQSSILQHFELAQSVCCEAARKISKVSDESANVFDYGMRMRNACLFLSICAVSRLSGSPCQRPTNAKLSEDEKMLIGNETRKHQQQQQSEYECTIHNMSQKYKLQILSTRARFQKKGQQQCLSLPRPIPIVIVIKTTTKPLCNRLFVFVRCWRAPATATSGASSTTQRRCWWPTKSALPTLRLCLERTSPM